VTLAAEVLRATAAEKLMIDMKRARDEKARFFDALERLNRVTKPAQVFDTVLEVADDRIRATCLGDSGRTWHLGWWRGAWGCQCPSNAFRRGCAHVLALRRVCNEPTRPTREHAGLTAARMRAAQDEATSVRNGRRSA